MLSALCWTSKTTEKFPSWLGMWNDLRSRTSLFHSSYISSLPALSQEHNKHSPLLFMLLVTTLIMTTTPRTESSVSIRNAVRARTCGDLGSESCLRKGTLDSLEGQGHSGYGCDESGGMEVGMCMRWSASLATPVCLERGWSGGWGVR